MGYKASNVKLADLEQMVRNVYSTFPDFVDESLLNARWIIDEYGIDHWNKFYAELTSGSNVQKSGSETQKNF